MTPVLDREKIRPSSQSATLDTAAPAGGVPDRSHSSPGKSQLPTAVVSPPLYSIPASPWRSDDGLCEEREGFVMLQKIIYGILVLAIVGAAITNILVLIM